MRTHEHRSLGFYIGRRIEKPKGLQCRVLRALLPPSGKEHLPGTEHCCVCHLQDALTWNMWRAVSLVTWSKRAVGGSYATGIRHLLGASGYLLTNCNCTGNGTYHPIWALKGLRSGLEVQFSLLNKSHEPLSKHVTQKPHIIMGTPSFPVPASPLPL